MPDSGERTEVCASRAQARGLRIGFVIDNLNIGGTELNALRTASRLLERGISLVVFSLSEDGPLRERYTALGIIPEVFSIPRLYGPTALQAGLRFRRRLRALRLDVLHAHDLYSNIFAAPWARLTGTPFIASRRWWEWPYRVEQRLANRAAYALADAALVNSESLVRVLRDEERVPPGRIRVVRNFVDEATFQPPSTDWLRQAHQELELHHAGPVIGSVASLSPVKDHATLVRAMPTLLRRFPDLTAVLVGRDAGTGGRLTALADALGVRDRIRLAGERPNQPSYHYLFDVSVLTSRSEGLPNSLLEAMAAGRAVVATEVGGVPDAVQHGTTGLLVAPGDPVQLAEAITRVLADPGLREQLGVAAYKRARSEYSPTAAIGSLLVVYTSLLRAEHA